MASLTDDNAADGNLDKRNIWLIGAGHTSILLFQRHERPGRLSPGFYAFPYFSKSARRTVLPISLIRSRAVCPRYFYHNLFPQTIIASAIDFPKPIRLLTQIYFCSVLRS